jgi:hypothetical protein
VCVERSSTHTLPLLTDKPLEAAEEHVQLAQQDHNWLVQVTIADAEPLERYGASLELHTQWVAEQLRQVCEPKGILCRVWHDQDKQYIQLSLQSSQ